MKTILTFYMAFICLNLHAQNITGTIKNENGEELPYSSVTVKGSGSGTSANGAGRFQLTLPAGNYTLVCQHLGYELSEKKIEVKGNIEVNFILKELNLSMPDVVVKSGGEDPAYKVIRAAIKKRSGYNNEGNSFVADRYGKDIIKLRDLPDKLFGKKIPKKEMSEDGFDSTGKGIIYLSESVSRISLSEPDKFKNEILKSRVSGSNSFGFSFPIFINFYSNNVSVFSSLFGKRGFISPISDNALNFYKYKLTGVFFEDGKMINAISVIPRRNYEPLFSGTINITEDDWRIHSCDLILTKTSQLEILDTLKINQIYGPADDSVWKIKTQYIYLTLKPLKIDLVGNFLSVYSDYKINPEFPKNFFDNTVVKYNADVVSTNDSFWDSIRPVPLEPEEIKDYHVKDSIKEKYSSPEYIKAMRDSAKKYENKGLITKLLLSDYRRTRYDTSGYKITGLKGLLPNLNYNTVEGANLTLVPYYRRKRNERTFYAEADFRYGFSNGHLNPSISFEWDKNVAKPGKKYTSSKFIIAGGKDVRQFSSENPIVPLYNSIGTLFYGENYMKIYEAEFVSIRYKKSFEKGFSFDISSSYEKRIPVNNTTDFTFYKKDFFTPNYPFRLIPSQFPEHKAVLLNAVLSFQGGQKYIEFPKQKARLGSDKAVYSLYYSKGIKNAFGSDVDFDKWEFDIRKNISFKLLGTSNLRIGTGGFLNDKKVFVQDLKHFNGNETRILANPLNGFQLANYYSNSTDADIYGFGFLEHHFNGFLTNKIPFFKKLNWHLVGGANVLYVDKNNNYSELFIGLENILKIFRVDFIAGYSNGNEVKSAFKFGINQNILSMFVKGMTN